MFRWILAGLFILIATPAYASCTESPAHTWTATTFADLQTCHDNAGFDAGDILILSQSVVASSKFTITKSLELKGASNCTLGTVHGIANIPTSCPVVITPYASDYTINVVLPASSDATTPTVSVHDLGIAAGSSGAQFIRSEGCGDYDARSFRIYNIYSPGFVNEFFINESSLGTMDHVQLVVPAAGVPAFIAYNFGHTWGACTTNNHGDISWASPDNFGTNKFFFYEYNVFDNSAYYNASPPRGLTGVDGDNGGRYVVRNNYFNAARPEAHGRESQNSRSIRAVESYNNVFDNANGLSSLGFFRGGTGVIHDNTADANAPVINLLALAVEEQFNAPYGGADGRNVWDSNDPMNPYDTLTETSSSQNTINASAESWTNHQWVGYQVRKTSGIAVTSMVQSVYTISIVTPGAHGLSVGDYATCWGASNYAFNNAFHVATVADATHLTLDAPEFLNETASGTLKCTKGSNFAYIADNDSDTLNLIDAPNGASLRLYPDAGGTFEINKVLTILDQPGMGQGDNLGGVGYPTASVLAGEAVSPWYEWSNTGSASSNVNFTTGFAGSCNGTCLYNTIVSGTHYKTDTTKPGYSAYTNPYPWGGSSCTPDHLAFPAQPGSVAVNVALGTVTVGVYDSGNNLCSSATNTITIANKGATCSGMTLGGTKSGAASSGVFTTTNLTEDVVGACTLSATASGLTGADSSAFTISAAGTGGGIGARIMLRIR